LIDNWISFIEQWIWNQVDIVGSREATEFRYRNIINTCVCVEETKCVLCVVECLALPVSVSPVGFPSSPQMNDQTWRSQRQALDTRPPTYSPPVTKRVKEWSKVVSEMEIYSDE